LLSIPVNISGLSEKTMGILEEWKIVATSPPSLNKELVK
jgi:hypothetical protein